MIYVSVLRVISSKEREGVNALMYDVRQAAQHYPDGRIDLAASIALELGAPARVHTAVRPGGNRVRAYIDLVLPDNDVELALQALHALEDSARAVEPPLLVEGGEYAASFNCDSSLYAQAPELLAELGGWCIRTLKGDPTVWTPERPPLVVEVHQDEDSVSFVLNEGSEHRVRSVRGTTWRAPRIRVEHGVFQDLLGVLPDAWGEVAAMLTGLPAERLLELGGVRFELVAREGHHKILVEWPER